MFDFDLLTSEELHELYNKWKKHIKHLESIRERFGTEHFEKYIQNYYNVLNEIVFHLEKK